jgi:lipase chaperone LimK
MKAIAAILLLAPLHAHALSAEAEEFIAISKQLAPVQCERQKLRREIALAEIERRDAKDLRARFSRLDRDPKTSRLEKRLAQLEPRLLKSNDGDDLAAISRQRREAFYRCD